MAGGAGVGVTKGNNRPKPKPGTPNRGGVFHQCRQPKLATLSPKSPHWLPKSARSAERNPAPAKPRKPGFFIERSPGVWSARASSVFSRWRDDGWKDHHQRPNTSVVVERQYLPYQNKKAAGFTEGGGTGTLFQGEIGRALSRFPSLSQQHCDLRNILSSRRLVVVDACAGFATEERGRWTILNDHGSLHQRDHAADDC
jgi:hypothetical protein